MTMDKGSRFWGSTRFFIAVVGFFGCAVIYSLRINLSIAMVCMVNQTYLDELITLENKTDNSSSKAAECKRVELFQNTTEEKLIGEFKWTKSMQGLLLGAFFWGYLLTQVLGGWLAQRFGATKILGFNVLLSTLVTLLSPVAARGHFVLIMLLRILLGIAQGVTFPAFHTLWSHWSPPLERSKLTGLTYAGCQVGNLITLPLAGVLCKHGFAGGWPSVFYVLGIASALWIGLWFFYASDAPTNHRFISKDEKHYIVSSLSHQMSDSEIQNAKHKYEVVATPWVQIFKSPAVWAIIAAHWAGDWAAYSMLTSLPSFLSEVLQFDMESLGFLASIPYIAYFLCINISGFMADFLREHKILSTVNTRRLMVSIALISQAVFLVAAGYCTCNQEYLVIALLTIGLGLSGFQYAGILANYIDIAPRFAGLILGIGNTLSCISGILTPYAMGLLTPNKTREEWLTLFWLTFAILIAGTIIFLIFAKGELQPWAVVNETKGEEMKDLYSQKTVEATVNDHTLEVKDRFA